MFKIYTETAFHGCFGLGKLVIQTVCPSPEILGVCQKFIDVIEVTLESRCFLVEQIQLRNLEGIVYFISLGTFVDLLCTVHTCLAR